MEVEEEHTTTPDEWTMTTDLVCPEGNRVEIHVYTNLSHASGTFCTLTLEGDGSTENKELEGLTATNNTAAQPNDIEIHGTLEKLSTQTHGACSAGLTLNLTGSLHLDITVSGTDEEGNPRGIEIS